MDPLTCATCGKTFKSIRSARQHARTHTGERPFACFHCDKRFKRKDHARRHMISHSKSNLPSFICNVEGCGKAFKLERMLKRHFDTTHATPFKCTFDGCELAFNKKYKMKKHRAIHNDGKVLKCTVEGCTSMFARRRNLLRHLQCHEREFKCKILGCDVVVKSFSELRKHLKGHKKVHCKQCDVVCPNKSTFQKHCREAHPVPKKTKFDCPFDGCSKIYSRGSNLNTHIRTEHNGLRFYCTVEGCDRVFRHNVTLKKHIASHETATKKKKRKRKSLAAKLARYNGELCDLPVTYVDPDDSETSETSACTEMPQSPLASEECCDVSKESSCIKEEQEERRSPALNSVEESSLPATASHSLIGLQMVRRDSQHHISGAKLPELCSIECNSETQNTLSMQRRQHGHDGPIFSHDFRSVCPDLHQLIVQIIPG